MSEPEPPANRLGGESSPYLRLHRHNPVSWYPWGDDALARARAEDLPIFLSVGYSTCYWCHVMERESFSDPGIAALLNRLFVSIKVDREERPDLDEVYMAATQILTQRGGWPNSVFLTPRLEPFFAGTYFPPEDRPGLPGFSTVLRSLAEAWRDRRDEVEEQARSVAAAMRRYLEQRPSAATGPPPPELATSGLDDLRRRFDPAWGGFGGAPKFPTPSNLLLLLEFAGEDRQATEMLDKTLDSMARGGIYDQLAGGFHRYATDREWRVPHFEKMLYDNGMLLEIYARHWRLSADPQSARVAAETVDFLAAEMTGPDGELWSAIDAETEGREGAYYVWRPEELRETLGEEDFAFLAPILGFDGPPSFEGEFHVLHLPESLAEQARRRRLEPQALIAEIAPLRARLLDARRRRQRPLTDDKILADWNGIAIAGLAAAGRLLDRRRWIERAIAAAASVLAKLRPAGQLAHSWRQQRLGPPAFLSDYAFLVRGLLELYRATEDRGWLERAEELTAEQQRRLADPQGGFFFAAARDDLLFRSKEVLDGALPGSNAVAVLNLVELAEHTDERRWLDRAEAALDAFAALAQSHPGGVKTLALAHRRFLQATAGPLSTGGPGTSEQPDSATGLPAEARRAVRPELVVAAADRDGWRPFTLRLHIAAGWHLRAASSAEASGGLRIGSEGVTLRSLDLPVARRSAEAGDGIYTGTVDIGGQLRISEPETARLQIHFQACDRHRCLPAARLDLPLDVD